MRIVPIECMDMNAGNAQHAKDSFLCNRIKLIAHLSPNLSRKQPFTRPNGALLIEECAANGIGSVAGSRVTMGGRTMSIAMSTI